MYTDGSKIQEQVRAGAIIMRDDIIHRLKYKLHNHCSNNQAEQFVILKALEKLQDMIEIRPSERKVAIFTDSKITIDSINNNFKHYPIIERIRSLILLLQNQQ